MTCIAGIAQGGKVWIGGDSAGVSGWALTVRADEKVFKRGPFIAGFTTSFRMGDLLRYALTLPEQTAHQTDREFLATSFVDALRTCLASGGYKKTENGVETGGTFLLGYHGNLYEIHDDFQVGQAARGYASCGCGRDIAHGALFAAKNLAPAQRVRRALEAAEAHSAAVCGPFTVISA